MHYFDYQRSGRTSLRVVSEYFKVCQQLTTSISHKTSHHELFDEATYTGFNFMFRHFSLNHLDVSPSSTIGQLKSRSLFVKDHKCALLHTTRLPGCRITLGCCAIVRVILSERAGAPPRFLRHRRRQLNIPTN